MKLAPDELELVASVLHDYLMKHREMARLKHACGELTKAELAWSLKHAEWAEGVFKKLLPGVKL